MISSRTVDVREAAVILGISRNRAWKSVVDGTIPTLRFGRRVRVPVAALERMLAEAGQPGTKESVGD